MAAHNKSPARLSEAYLCTVYFCGDYVLAKPTVADRNLDQLPSYSLPC